MYRVLCEYMVGNFFIKNGILSPIDQATLPVDNLELSYGFGVYESLRVRHQSIYFLTEHVERLFFSAQCLGLEHPFSLEQITDWSNQLVKANQIEAANIKMLLLGGKTPADAHLYIFLTAPRFLDKKEYRDGVKVITFHHERFMPQAKTLNMLPSYLAYRQASEVGAFDALLIDREGCIREGTRTNFFAIKNTTLYTPPVEIILNGITRQTVIKCAEENGFAVKEVPLPLKNIFEYDGAFVTNTSGGIVPVAQIDEKRFPEISMELQRLRKKFEG